MSNIKTRRQLAVFTYAFQHHRTQDFLLEIAATGGFDVHVIAAPWRKLSGQLVEVPVLGHGLERPPPRCAKEISSALNFNYHEIEHAAVDKIGNIVSSSGIKIGLIAGARILSSSVINIFDEGIINIHPGKIPETSGLDSFFYTITKGVELGVTTHFIDARVDAGRQIQFLPTKINPNDTIEIVRSNNSQTELLALKNILNQLKAGEIISTPIDRPKKNVPMSLAEKCEAVSAFPRWRARMYLEQQRRALFRACESGQVDDAASILEAHPEMLNCRNEHGWTPLIVACFNQRFDCAKKLMFLGADPNIGGNKGTTPLMYAKTALLNKPDAGYQLLDTLVEHGAEVARVDANGLSLFDYVTREDDRRMLRWILDHTSRE